MVMDKTQTQADKQKSEPQSEARVVVDRRHACQIDHTRAPALIAAEQCASQ